jgi:hypothetical protein
MSLVKVEKKRASLVFPMAWQLIVATDSILPTGRITAFRSGAIDIFAFNLYNIHKANNNLLIFSTKFSTK